MADLIRYRPPHQRQLIPSDPHGNVNCAAYALAMALDYATVGGLRTTGRVIRAASDEPRPDPDSPGLSVRQLVSVSRALHVPLIDKSGYGWPVVVSALAGRRAAVVAIRRAYVPFLLRYAPFRGAHMVLLTELTPDGRLAFTYDPLADQAHWVSAEHLARAMVKLTADPRPQWAMTRAVPLVAG